MELTVEQRRVQAHRGRPALVLAVAGAGKTTSLLKRILALMQAGVPGSDILLTTFSKRGAADMELRGVRLGVPSGVNYRTLHSVAFEMIRQARMARVPVIPKSWMLTRIVKQELKAAPVGYTERPKIGDVFKEIALAKASMIWPSLPGEPGEWMASAACYGEVFPDYVTWATTRPRKPLGRRKAEVIARCYAAIEIAGRAPEAAGFEPSPNGRDRIGPERWVTFDDMLALVARAVLRRGPTDVWVDPHRARFEEVMVDEVQDNNRAQWVMVEHLARDRRIMAVGDDMQAIFSFRGARPELMREFVARYPDAEILPLSFNFRCGQTILDTANAVLSEARERLYQGMLRRGRPLAAVGTVYAFDGTDAQQEADRTANAIEAAIRDGENPDDIAVLYRINAQSGPVEVELIKRGITYRVAGSSFFSRGEIRAAIGYLACALDPDDEDGFFYCYNAPTRYLGQKFLSVCPSVTRTRAAASNNELGRWRGHAVNLLRTIDEVGDRLRGKEGLRGALHYIFEAVGVRKHFREEGTSEDDETEVDEACKALLGCCAKLQDAPALIAFARAMSRVAHEDMEGTRDRLPRVTLSTVHKAKGLEWRVVHLIGASEGQFPLKNPDVVIEEERRLFYVAVTRAKDILWVSWQSDPSIFVKAAGLTEKLPPEPLPQSITQALADAAGAF